MTGGLQPIAQRTFYYDFDETGGAGHQGDPAAAILEDHLPRCSCGSVDGYERPLEEPHFSSSAFVDLETQLRLVLGCGQKRMPMLSHVLRHDRDYPRRRLQADRQELAACWKSMSVRAPVDRLVVNPAICTVDRLRLQVARCGLKWVGNCTSASWRLGTLLLFGLRALVAAPNGRPVWTALGHGYWWSSMPA